MTKYSEQEKKMSKARTRLIMDHPFFGSLVLKLALVPDPRLPTMATDGTCIRYSPKFVDKITLDEVIGVLAHEALHVAFCHPTRGLGLNWPKWAMATDYAINPILNRAGFKLPGGHLLDWQYEHMFAERIYTKLPDPPEMKMPMGGGGGSGQGNDDEDGQGQQGHQHGDDGCSDGCGMLEPMPGKDGGKPTQAEKTQAEIRSMTMLAQARAMAKSCGNMPGDLDTMLNELFHPKVPWRQILRRFAEQHTRDDYTWARPNPRYTQRGFYLPTLHNREIKNLVWCVDNSGSVSKDEYNQFGSELVSCLQTCNVGGIHLIFCDSQVNTYRMVKKTDLPVPFQSRGGGGTSFKPPFEWIAKKGIIPSAFIYLTDGECYSFPERPMYPVLWAITNSKYVNRPPFGEVIDLEM